MATWLVSGKVEFEIEREITAETEEEAIEKVEESIYENYGYGDIDVAIEGNLSCCFYGGWGYKLDD